MKTQDKNSKTPSQFSRILVETLKIRAGMDYSEISALKWFQGVQLDPLTGINRPEKSTGK
ncbi:MAG: hypothetical protein PHQ23_00905 [Candidatus Wallbacteria bacterium]|nr:hypothetical protein [Candidatus Wallbacteria bacterium]